ncbi:MAG: relaxase MobL [Candidatus Ornithomonoglobus sp.]
MTPKIIFKQRDRPAKAKHPYAAVRNAEHLRYIGERDGVAKTETEEHLRYLGNRPGAAVNADTGNGLFGYINNEYYPSCSMEAAQSHIRKMTTPYRNIFRCVFSFTPETAEEAGLYSLSDWQSFARKQIGVIAKHMNMDATNIEWFAAVHLKEGQPHIHLMYWDKAQSVYINKVAPETCDKIRVEVIKNTYHDFYVNLRSKENELLGQFKTEVGKETGAAPVLDEIAERLEKIRSMLPKTGRLVYAYMPQPVKDEINALTTFIIQSSDEARRLYEQLIETRRIYNETLHSTETDWGKYQIAKYAGKMNDDIYTAAGNAIIKAIRQGERATQNNPRGQFVNNRPHTVNTEKLLLAVLTVIRNAERDSNNALNEVSRIAFGRGDLSREAIAEILYKLADKQNTAEF